MRRGDELGRLGWAHMAEIVTAKRVREINSVSEASSCSHYTIIQSSPQTVLHSSVNKTVLIKAPASGTRRGEEEGETERDMQENKLYYTPPPPFQRRASSSPEKTTFSK